MLTGTQGRKFDDYKPMRLDDLLDEVSRGVTKFGSFTSLHEIYGVLKEEVREFEDEVFLKTGTPRRAAEELLQVAAVAFRAYEEIMGMIES